MPFIRNLKDIRLGLGLSQAEFARKAGIDRETVSRCEHGYSAQDTKCEKMRQALISAGFTGDIVVDPNGKSGDIPRKGKAKANPRK